jgi:hypothetical protein
MVRYLTNSQLDELCFIDENSWAGINATSCRKVAINALKEHRGFSRAICIAFWFDAFPNINAICGGKQVGTSHRVWIWGVDCWTLHDLRYQDRIRSFDSIDLHHFFQTHTVRQSTAAPISSTEAPPKGAAPRIQVEAARTSFWQGVSCPMPAFTAARIWAKAERFMSYSFSLELVDFEVPWAAI